MKLRQLQYLLEVTRQEFSVSAAATNLFTSQPGVSKQIRALEDELGMELFYRRGKLLVGPTQAGQAVAALAREILDKVGEIQQIAADYAGAAGGHLKIATTHTQARYALPPAIEQFLALHPAVELDIYQGTPDQLVTLAQDQAVDLVIATEALDLFADLVLLPCYFWNRSILVPVGHPLVDVAPLTLRAIADYPLVTYVFAVGGHQLIENSFGAAGISPRVALTAVDTDVIKTYVRLGLGVGIVASMAYDVKTDGDLVALPADHLFADSITMIGLRPGRYVRRHVVDFVEKFAPHLTAAIVASAVSARPSKAPFDHLPAGFQLPRR